MRNYEGQVQKGAPKGTLLNRTHARETSFESSRADSRWAGARQFAGPVPGTSTICRSLRRNGDEADLTEVELVVVTAWRIRS
jgi:hypothetical protein